jgi:hypothetical protein
MRLALVILALAQLGGKPQPLTTLYHTEFAWAVGQSVADIAEMAAAAHRQAVAPVAAPAGVLPWTPEALVELARTQFGQVPASSPGRPQPANQYPALAHLTAEAVARASETVSASLRQNMRSSPTHESAALVLSAFGLREAARDMSDIRWTLNRMTAHLAVAEALRVPGAGPSTDGQLARVAFLALANRSASGLAALEAIADRPADAPLAAWKRALRLRLTGDWRITTVSALAYRVEKLEYFRARRQTLRTVRAGEELTSIKEPVAADVARIVQHFSYGVEDGGDIVAQALGAELLELSAVYRLVERRELPVTLPPAIVNLRAGRLMSDGGPRVVPWGAWAEFAQRHIGMHVVEMNHFYRHLYGSPERADEIKTRFDLMFRAWTMFPVASAQWTKGPRGAEADLRHINQAIDVAYRSPELVNYGSWSWLAFGAAYEVVARGMPDRAAWFVTPPSAAVPYDAGIRARDVLTSIPLPAVEALIAEASSDVSLHARALAPRPNGQALAARIRQWFEARAGFDLYAIDAAVAWSPTLAEDITWRQRGCALSVSQCLSLAWLHAYARDEARAVEEYERAFRSPALDAVSMSNFSAWLVSYYERSNQLERAYDLATRSAAVGSARGMTTLARLHERRGRLDEAETLYRRIAERYVQSSEELAGFLYRQAIVAGKAAYLDRWRALERQLFPAGLRRLPDLMRDKPATGVFVYEDSSWSRRVRLQAGDIIVGVDGWLVENKDQYDAVIAFS